jgi:hypothetical protein
MLRQMKCMVRASGIAAAAVIPAVIRCLPGCCAAAAAAAAIGADGSASGVFLLNSNGLDVELQDDRLTYR